MEDVVKGQNMEKALRAVERNKGAAGVDGMAVREMREYLRDNWRQIKEELLDERYKPKAVRSVKIPKPGGGERQLGIPTVVDRMIQQALHQVMSPVFEAGFSEHSYGFRPGRGAWDAVRRAREYVREGKRWVVDLDIEKYFDRVNHDMLMARVARKIRDKRILKLIRRFLQSGIMQEGVTVRRDEGTPQGGPLSPLLSNIFLDDLDKELEMRSHRFCRYADDLNVYVGSRKAGESVMASVTRFLEKRMKLKVNRAKSAVARPWQRKFLGYSMTFHKKPRLKPSVRAVKRLKDKLKTLFRQGKGRNVGRFIKENLNPVLRGWGHYFSLSQVKGVFEELDQWLRRRLRCVIWRQWKRSWTRVKGMIRRGIDKMRAIKSAFNGRGPWWNSGRKHMNDAFPKKYFDQCGLVSLTAICHGNI